jgi:hypothetical protein
VYSFDYRQYILKQSSGKMWNLYHDDRLGLCYSTLNKRNTWNEPISLQKQIFKNFFAEIDSEDNFHILFQNSSGNIYYSQLDSYGGVKTSPVLNSKIPAAYNKFLRVIPFKNEKHFFYVLQHSNKMILAHQVYTNSAVATPKVIDYAVDNSWPYCVAADKSNNIYAFYQLSDGKHMQIGYKKYISSQKLWGEFTPITRYSGDCEFPRTVVDSKDIIHICYQRRSQKQYELIYQQKIPDKNIWTNECIIHSSPYSFEDASVLCANDKVIVYWVRNDTIYYSSSNDSGISWSKPTRYNFFQGRQLMCLYYSSNVTYEKEKTAIRDVPGVFTNGLKVAFYSEAVESSPANLSPSELKNMIVESLKLLKGGIEELKESDSGIRDDIARLSIAHQALEKDIIKYSVKLDLLENEIKQLKVLSSRLEDFKKSVTEIKTDLESCQRFSKAPELPDIISLKSEIISDVFKDASFKEVLNVIENLKNRIDSSDTTTDE